MGSNGMGTIDATVKMALKGVHIVVAYKIVKKEEKTQSLNQSENQSINLSKNQS